MKRVFRIFITTIILLSGTSMVFAQFKPNTILNDPDYERGKRLRFGFSLGLNFMDFTVRSSVQPQVSFASDTTHYFVDNSHLIPGFNVNVVSDLRLTENFHLRFLPGLAFGQRDVSFYHPQGQNQTTMKLESSFIEMPLVFKYSAMRKTNMVPYLIGGINYRLDMAAYKKLNVEQGVLIRLVKGDFYYEVGLGFDHFLTFFKLSTEVKFSSGFFNVFANDYAEEGENYALSIKQIRSNVVSLVFHFE